MRKLNSLNIWLVAAILYLGTVASAEETKVEKLETQKNEAVDKVKSSYRSTKDKVCNMVHGKLECIEKRSSMRPKTLVTR